MDLFLVHCLFLIWASIGAARRLAASIADQLLVAALLAWGNIVATSLFLAALHRLGEPRWFLGVSGLLGMGTCLLLLLVRPESPSAARACEFSDSKPSPWLVRAFGLTLAPLALASIAIGYSYQPDSPDALTWHLPRVMYYLGQNTLAHFSAADLRQVQLPFNYNLLQLFCLVYSPPLQCLNLFNLVAWVVCGIAVYRLCRLGGFGANSSLITCWLALTITPVIAQANSATNELPAGAAFICAFVFALRWAQTQRTQDALLTGLAAGLAAGSSLSLLLILLGTASLIVAWAWTDARRTVDKPGPVGVRPWIVPGILAFALGAPFALINLAQKGPWLDLDFYLAHHREWSAAAQDAWTWLIPQLRTPSPLLPLNEGNIGFGLAGPLFLLGTVLCLTRRNNFSRPMKWLCWLGLSGVLVRLSLFPWWPSSPRDFIPALLLLSPGVAAVIEAAWTSRRLPRYASYGLILIIALTAEWSAVTYVLRNTRPALPLLNAAFIRPPLPALPLLVEYHVTKQPRVNIDTDGINERIFPIMAAGHSQQFTSHGMIAPGSYNLLSRSSASRNAPYITDDRMPAYVMIAIPPKPTAGVEFLATIGTGSAARDYFGIEPNAGGTAPINSNRSLLVTLYHESARGNNPALARIKVAGLNPSDHARLVVGLEFDDGNRTPLTTFTADGETAVAIDKPFRQLAFRAYDVGTGAEIGAAVIPYQVRSAESPELMDSAQPTNASSLFVTDVVLDRKSKVLASEGLFPVEGPFPQWDIPFIRWARQPTFSLRIPATANFVRLQLSFSVRLHVRKKGSLAVWFNGKFVQRYRIDDPSIWLDQTLELSPQAGENVLEFKDAPLNDEPDWMGYLERYPDVKKYVLSQNLPLEQGARDHYETNGRAEGRILQIVSKPEPAPDSYYFMYRKIRLEGFRSR